MSKWQDILTKLKSISWLSWLVAVTGCAVSFVGMVLLLPWHRLSLALHSPDTLERKIWVWVFASIFSWILVMALFFIVNDLKSDPPPNAGMVFSVFWAIAVAMLIFLLIPVLPESKSVYAYLAGIGGGVVGWLLGLFISPQGIQEQQQFAVIGTKVTALVSGVAGLSAKALYDKLSNTNQTHRSYVGLFFLSATLGVAAVYNTRAYGNRVIRINLPEGSNTDSKNKRKLVIPKSKAVKLNAAVTGVEDTCVKWSIYSRPDSSSPIKDSVEGGNFITDTAGEYKIQAQSTFDPRMVDTLEITVQ